MSRTVKTTLFLLALGLLVLAVASRKAAPVRTGSGLDKNCSEVSGKLVIFHAGSLAVPFKQMCEEFNRHYPHIRIFREAAGSRVCARKVADLNRSCDVMASADYTVIETLLIPEYADWNIKFAGNEMVIVFRSDSRRAEQISKDNWCDILLEKDVTFGRSDPNLDPCGYRTVLVLTLAEKFYNRPGFACRLLAKDQRYIRPKEVDLLALLEADELDYVLIYRSIARQHELEILLLPDQINLKSTEFADFYKSASVRLTGKKPGTFFTKVGEPILYGVTIPKNAANRRLALLFLSFLLDADRGGAILEKNGQSLVAPSPTDTFDRLPECLKIFSLPVSREGKR